jgi:hypothetical protein
MKKPKPREMIRLFSHAKDNTFLFSVSGAKVLAKQATHHPSWCNLSGYSLHSCAVQAPASALEQPIR